MNMIINLVRIKILLFGVFSCGLLQAEVFELIDYQYYEIPSSLESNKSIEERLNTASPIRKENLVHHSITRWKISWEIQKQILADQMCGIKTVKVDLDALIHLPQINGETNAALQQEFNNYVKQLQTHEVAHYMLFAIQAANDIDIKLINLVPAANCELLDIDANEIATSVLDQYRTKEQQWDIATNYGKPSPVMAAP